MSTFVTHPVTYLIDLGRIKGRVGLGASQGF